MPVQCSRCGGTKDLRKIPVDKSSIDVFCGPCTIELIAPSLASHPETSTMHKLLLMVAIAAALIQPALAELREWTGNDWEADCAAPEAYKHLACLEYARGVREGLEVWRMMSRSTALVCIPGEVTTGQIVEVDRKFIKENPEHRHLPIRILLTRAFKVAWPCE